MKFSSRSVANRTSLSLTSAVTKKPNSFKLYFESLSFYPYRFWRPCSLVSCTIVCESIASMFSFVIREPFFFLLHSNTSVWLCVVTLIRPSDTNEGQARVGRSVSLCVRCISSSLFRHFVSYRWVRTNSANTR
jgi:hypothetical protein